VHRKSRRHDHGFTEIECEELAHLIADVLDAPADDKTH
jgi:hypothetical protein